MPFDFYLVNTDYHIPTVNRPQSGSQVFLSLGGVITHLRIALHRALHKESSVVKFLEGKSIARFPVHSLFDLEQLEERGF